MKRKVGKRGEKRGARKKQERKDTAVVCITEQQMTLRFIRKGTASSSLPYLGTGQNELPGLSTH